MLPKPVRERQVWPMGTVLEVVEHGGSVTLRPVVKAVKKPAAEVFARLREINPYRGPPITDEEIDRIVREQELARYQRSFDHPVE